MSVTAFLTFIGGLATDSNSTSRAAADTLGLIDSSAERQEPLAENGWTNEIVMREDGMGAYSAPHHNGVQMDSWPAPIFGPSSYNETAEAVIEQLSGKPVAVWFHQMSLNLVLESPDGKRPGLKSNVMFFRGEGANLIRLLQERWG